MNEMCRLCLSVLSESMCILTEDCDILKKINQCLSVEISLLNKTLPSNICSACITKIEDIHCYHKKVQYNQEILLNLSINNKLEKDKAEGNNVVLKLETNISDEDYNVPNSFENEIIKEEPYINSDDEVLSKVRTNETSRQQSMKKGLSKNISNSENLQHKCLMCSIICKSQNDLVQHYNQHHDNISKSDIKNKKIFKTYTSDNGTINYECCTCTKSYSKSQDIENHIAGHLRPFVCKLCGRTYRSAYEIVRHGRVHNGEILHCSFRCGFNSVYKGALRNHERRHSSQEFKFKCEKCEKGFQVKTWYDQHQNVHSGLKPYCCDLCGVAFHMDRYLTAHRSKMHPQTSSIKKHLCVICSQPCDTRNSLRRHMEEHGVKPTLLCDLCGKVFTNSELLKYHKNSHLGVKPYTCSVCNKTFVKKFNLKMHERTHTGEKAHSCSHCGKCFTQSSALRRHERRYHTKLLFQENVASTVVEGKS